MTVNVSRGLVVTGTDTSVGKTVVSAALCQAWSRAGHDVAYVKPVQSGAADGDDDAADVGSLVDVPTVVGPVVGPSLAPSVAVRRAGGHLLRAELVGIVTEAMARYRRVVVEGAGGLLVELGTDGTNVADLAEEVGLPVLVVARPGLGTLNHTALTLAVLAHRGIDLVGVVVADTTGTSPDLAARTNLDELRRLTGDRVVGQVPHLTTLAPAALQAAATWFRPPLV